MGTIYPLTTLRGSAGIPNYGALLGTAASIDLINALNENRGQTFFGAQFHDVTEKFMRETIAPMRAVAQQIQFNAAILLNPDVICPLVTLDAFATIPSEMQLPILLYAPVRDLFERGRIEGFGFDPEFLPKEDVYGRLLANGRVEDIEAARDKDGFVHFHWHMESDDPVLTDEQHRALRDTREYIDWMLANTEFDPTSYPNIRG